MKSKSTLTRIILGVSIDRGVGKGLKDSQVAIKMGMSILENGNKIDIIKEHIIADSILFFMRDNGEMTQLLAKLL